MTLLSPPGHHHALADHHQNLVLPMSSPTTATSSRDHHHRLNNVGSLSVADDMPMLLPRSPKLLRTNSSKKVAAASNLERALLSFKSWESASAGAIAADASKTAAVPPPPPPSPSPMKQQQQERRIHGARPGRLALIHHNSAAVSRPPTTPTTMAADDHAVLRSPLHDAAATRVQKFYKGHRTRRTLADCAIVIEELWWKLYDSASLNRTSISFFTGAGQKQETAASRWVRAGKRVAKVGKGLAKDDKAQKLALRHWLEAIDPRHRYGHNLHLYYHLWFQSATSNTEPFFYWLDVGGGKDVHHPSCGRSKLNAQLVTYLGATERKAYQVVVDDDGRLTYLQSRQRVDTTSTTDDDGGGGGEGSSNKSNKWIFVLSTDRVLYVGKKRKGQFQHSSFLAGGATSAAGRLVAKDGVLQAIWPYSGHYLPTEENFDAFIAFLKENHVDLTDVKRCSVDDDDFVPASVLKRKHQQTMADNDSEEAQEPEAAAPGAAAVVPAAKWASGAGARIGCVRDYPAELQSRALEHVNLSPNRPKSPWAGKAPIPSPRPSPRIRLSPRVQYMGMGVPAASPAAGVRTPLSPPLKQQCLGLGIRPPTVHLTLPASTKNASKATTTSSDQAITDRHR